MNEVREIFHHADVDGNGQITLNEFKEQLRNFRVQVCLSNVGIDVLGLSPAAIFSAIDSDCSGVVDIDEFILGIQQVRGPARNVSVFKLERAINKVDHRIESTEATLQFLQRLCQH